MEGSGQESRVLRIRATRAGAAEQSRAALIVDRLAASRAVAGEGPEWTVAYAEVDIGMALGLCQTDLEAIDPGWMEVLDFEAVPSRPLPEAEFS